ncbi:ATP-binding cassette domain-containing protein [Actinoplanes sp. N902-109]|uniref:ATP-binding cassette domain-containing protein n=1 Tax=Actinoplanes sp. (strain N902-109) TaxID=649831 RepID=UPI0003296427|nr:ATP-binding cassette domain-containing protein [Actinoplanes sp. N902-109]AGL16629.1 daunorubicin resistance ABC transporter ATPase subunit [Actinoplanes sp. N902-109]
MTPAIEAQDLVKTYRGGKRALDGLSFSVAPGTVLGLLGLNGAGKTTAVGVLATLVRPDSGRAFVRGHDVVTEARAVRRIIGLTGQHTAVDELLPGRENLYLIGRLLGLRGRAARARADQLVDAFDLTEAAGRTVKTYSGGTRRRLDLAASLVGRPSTLFLDEPTTGLDPRSRTQVWNLVQNLVADGTAVLLTTQYLDEADQLARRIVVMDHGRAVADGTPAELKAAAGAEVLEVGPVRADQLEATRAVVAALTGAEPAVDAETQLVSVALADPALLAVAVRRLDEAGIAVGHLALRRPRLDEAFLSLVHEPPVLVAHEKGAVG